MQQDEPGQHAGDSMQGRAHKHAGHSIQGRAGHTSMRGRAGHTSTQGRAQKHAGQGTLACSKAGQGQAAASLACCNCCQALKHVVHLKSSMSTVMRRSLSANPSSTMRPLGCSDTL